MLACDKTITLIQVGYDSEMDEDTYTQHVIRNVSWFSKVKVEVQDKGVTSADVVKIRIPEKEIPEGVRLSNGDFVVLGLIDHSITKREDLDVLEPVTIVSVGDNRRGNLPHWAVTCV